MLKDLLTPQRKWSKASYKKFLQIYCLCLFLLGLVLILSAFKLKEYEGGLAIGSGIGMIIVCSFFTFQMMSPKRFNKLYIKATDERNRYLNGLSYQIIYGLLLILALIAFIINIYQPITIAFQSLLLAFIFFITYGFFIIKAILARLV